MVMTPQQPLLLQDSSQAFSQEYACTTKKRNEAAAEAMQAESQAFDAACKIEELQARAAASRVSYSCVPASNIILYTTRIRKLANYKQAKSI